MSFTSSIMSINGIVGTETFLEQIFTYWINVYFARFMGIHVAYEMRFCVCGGSSLGIRVSSDNLHIPRMSKRVCVLCSNAKDDTLPNTNSTGEMNE